MQEKFKAQKVRHVMNKHHIDVYNIQKLLPKGQEKFALLLA